MLVNLEIAFLWVGFLSTIAIVGIYLTQRWWKTHIGRFIVMIKSALLLLYTESIVQSITNPDSLKGDWPGVLITGLVGSILFYGVIAFSLAIKESKNADRH